VQVAVVAALPTLRNSILHTVEVAGSSPAAPTKATSSRRSRYEPSSVSISASALQVFAEDASGPSESQLFRTRTHGSCAAFWADEAAEVGISPATSLLSGNKFLNIQLDTGTAARYTTRLSQTMFDPTNFRRFRRTEAVLYGGAETVEQNYERHDSFHADRVRKGSLENGLPAPDTGGTVWYVLRYDRESKRVEYVVL